MKIINADIPFEELPFHLDLKESDVVFITSDLKNFALKSRKEQKNIDVNAFINNFKSILKKGTIFIPTYTDYLQNGKIFDYEKSKASTGAISNRVLKRADFQRTTDPLHSVCVWGEDKEEVLKMKDESTFGAQSIFKYLHNKNAVFLFFDVHINKSFTFIHYVEEQLNVPYRKFKNWVITIKKDGYEKTVPVKFHTKKWGVISDVEELNAAFLERKLMKRYNYSGIYIDKITANDTADTVKEFISNKKYLYHFDFKEYCKSFVKSILRMK